MNPLMEAVGDFINQDTAFTLVALPLETLLLPLGLLTGEQNDAEKGTP